MKKLILSMILFSSVSFTGTTQTNFAQDIHVTTANDFDCTNERVSVAYNGDIYIGRLRKISSATDYTRWEVVKSTDNGATWTVFKSGSLQLSSNSSKYTSFDMIVAGNAQANNFRVYVVAGIMTTNGFTGNISASLEAYNYNVSGTATALSFNGQSFNNAFGGYRSVSLASDWKQKNSNATNYTISCAVVKSVDNGGGTVLSPNFSDSIVGFTTQNSLTNFNRRSYYGTTQRRIRSVSAAVGSCASNVSTYGRFGIVWDEISAIFQINNYTAHVKALFAYPDNGNIAPYGGLQIIDNHADSRGNPSIALSQEAGETDVRAVITYERVLNGFNLVRRAKSNTLIGSAPNFTGTKYISPGSRNSYGTHVVYDPVYNNFLHVYYNATQITMPYKLTSLNSTPTADPSMPSGNIRDANTTISNVNPRVDYANSSAGAVFVWNDNMKTMFDYQTSTLDIQEIEENFTSTTLFPNPASQQITLDFSALDQEEVEYFITDITGREVYRENAILFTGDNRKTVDVSMLENGHYLFIINGIHQRKSIKFMVNK